MTSFDRAVIFGNATLALTAFIVNAVAAHRSEEPWRTVRVLVASLSILYAGAYLWLGTHPAQQPGWSQVMRGVSLTAWPVVWIGPAFVSLRYHQRTKRIVDRTLGEK